MAKYWNGRHWVEDPPMATLSSIKAVPNDASVPAERRLPEGFDVSDVRAALVDEELNPRTKTAEVPPLVKLEIEVEDPPVPEQPTPNLVDKSVDVFTRNPVHIRSDDTPTTGRTVTRDRQELKVPNFVTCDDCSSEFDSTEGGCPVCLVLKATDEKVVDPEEVVITDEVRERLRRELGIKVDGGSD